MAIFKQSTLKKRFIYAFLFVIIVTITIASVTNYFFWHHNYLKQISLEELILTRTLARGSYDPIIRNDFSTLEEFVFNLTDLKNNIAYIIIRDRHDLILARYPDHLDQILFSQNMLNRKNLFPDQTQTYYNSFLHTDINDIIVPVIIDKRQWGSVRVGFSCKDMKKNIFTNILAIILTSMVSILTGIIVALFLSKRITGPIDEFINVMKDIAQNGPEKEIGIDTKDEFGTLAFYFNNMAKSLKIRQHDLIKTEKDLSKKEINLIEEKRKKDYQLACNERMIAIGELTSHVTHKIKNRLGIISSSVEIMIDEENSYEIRHEIGSDILGEISQLDMEICNILNNAGPKPPNNKYINLNNVIEDCIHLWETQKLEKQNIIITKKYGKIPPIFFDEEQISIITINMIKNAFESMPCGGKLKISTSFTMCSHNSANHKTSISNMAADKQKMIRIEFEDTGVGIPQGNFDKIFDLFFTTRETGTGIGLTSVHRIIEDRTGKIEVESEENKGTKFIIYLPLE